MYSLNKMSKKDFNEFVKKNLSLAGALDGLKAYKGPEIVQIDLTNNCNLNCVGCWCHSTFLKELKLKGKEKKRKLPYEMVKKLIEDLYKLGTKEIMLSGSGEPFMYPKIMEIISLIKEKDIKLNIITNFTLVNKKIIKKLVDLNVDYITASLWAGDAETYVKTHPNQTKKTFERIRENLKYLHSIKKENNLPRVKIYNVISKFNYGKIENMINFALDTLVDYIEFQVIEIVPKRTEILRLQEGDKKKILKQILDFKKRKDYSTDFIGTTELEKLDRREHKDEFKDFGRFYKPTKKGFRLIIKGEWAICPRGYLSIRKDFCKIFEPKFLFHFPNDLCSECSNNNYCYEHKKSVPLKAEFLTLLGFGSFYRRISNESLREGYDSNIIDSISCYVGWIYARILTNGDIIPCCKAHLFALGNLYKNSFKDIWFSKKYNEFRKKAKNTKKSDVYFKKIGCYKGCDNLGMILATHKKMKELNPLKVKLLNKRKLSV